MSEHDSEDSKESFDNDSRSCSYWMEQTDEEGRPYYLNRLPVESHLERPKDRIGKAEGKVTVKKEPDTSDNRVRHVKQEYVKQGYVKQEYVKQEDFKQEYVKQGYVKQEDVKQEYVKQGYVKQECVKPRHVKQECVKPGYVKQECVKSGYVKQECVKPGYVKQECVKSGYVKQKDVKQKNVKREYVKREHVKQEDVKQKDVKPKDVKQKIVKQEYVKQEYIKQEDVKQEYVKQEDVKQEYVKQEDVKQEEFEIVVKQEPDYALESSTVSKQYPYQQLSLSQLHLKVKAEVDKDDGLIKTEETSTLPSSVPNCLEMEPWMDSEMEENEDFRFDFMPNTECWTERCRSTKLRYWLLSTMLRIKDCDWLFLKRVQEKQRHILKKKAFQ
ncbi:Glutamine-rich protein [Trichinella spiralis]|uniref:Glutamine-rich protein n=1 Tax=Trichinella spiralis TaxID=6334 RepID=A0ABR3K412_TRISP